MMDDRRRNIERAILEHYFPKRYRFMNEGSPDEELEVGIRTQSEKVYLIRIPVGRTFPNSVPQVYVVWPLPLLDYYGKEIEGASHEMHTLGNNGMQVQICHYKPDMWSNNVSLYKVIFKVWIWLEAYEGHLRTGQPIDHFLNS